MQFSLKPVFIGWITLLSQLPLQLFMTIWAGGFFGGLIGTLFGVIHGGKDNNLPPYPFLFFGGLAFFGIPIVTYFGKKLNYKRAEYKFFDDRLEFEEGFFTINKKVIKYKDVKEVTLRKGMVQRMYGLGTIYLATLATGSSPSNNSFATLGFGNVSASGVSVKDIAHPDDYYEKIKTLIDKQTH